MRKLILSATLLLGLAQAAMATTYYVRSGGSPGHSCTLAQTNDDSHAKQTIQDVVTNCNLQPDDIVHIGAGTFNESVTGIPSGTSGHPVVFEGEGTHGANTVWRHTGNVATLGYSDAAVYINNRSYNKFHLIKFDGTNAPATIYSVANGGSGVVGIEINDCTFSNDGNNGTSDGFSSNSKVIYLNGTGAFPNGGHTITGCFFTTNKGYNILHNHGTLGSAFTNNDFTNMLNSPGAGLEAIHAGSGCTMLTVTGNTIHDSALGGGIKFDAGVTQSTVSDNIVKNLTGANVLALEGESGVNDNTFSRNIVSNIIDGEGMRIGSYNTNTANRNVVQWNSFANCKCGITLGQSISGTIKNNIISLGAGVGSAIFLSNKSSGNVFKNNIYYRNGNANIGFGNATNSNCYSGNPPNLTLAAWSAATGDVNSKNADPLYVVMTAGSEDLHLQAGSPAINAADDGTNMGAYVLANPPPNATIAISNPNGAEDLVAGDIINITWDTTQTGNCKIELARDGATYAETLTGSVACSAMSYSWTVTPPGRVTTALFKITSLSVGTVTDTSDAAVNIHGKYISVLPQ